VGARAVARGVYPHPSSCTAYTSRSSKLAELGIDSARMVEDLGRGFAFRQQHQASLDRDSWLCGWFDALEWFRCQQ
jgi:hypothetical protein